jgi:hypothetical protein
MVNKKWCKLYRKFSKIIIELLDIIHEVVLCPGSCTFEFLVLVDGVALFDWFQSIFLEYGLFLNWWVFLQFGLFFHGYIRQPCASRTPFKINVRQMNSACQILLGMYKFLSAQFSLSLHHLKFSSEPSSQSLSCVCRMPCFFQNEHNLARNYLVFTCFIPLDL